MLLARVLAGLLTSAAAAQTTHTIDFSRTRQTLQGFGVTATATWIPEVAALYGRPEFAARIREDLGASIIRLALPPDIQPNEDLDAATLNLDAFDFTKFNPPANFIRTIHNADPSIKVILSIWSPPAWMKTNTSTTHGGHLRPDRRDHFAKFCAAACLGFEQAYGIGVHALSIQNEPYFTQTYDSCLYSPEEMRDTIDAVAAAFKRWNVRARLMAPEDFADEPRWNKYTAAIAASKKTSAALSALNLHGEPEGEGGAAALWPRFHTLAKRTNLPIWMTETSGELPAWRGTGRKRGAIDLARSIHDALVFGQCEAWVYWAISDPAPSEFALMSLAEPTPKYFALRQYARFIRPGAVRIEVPAKDPAILASAYLHEADRTRTVIIINTAAADHEVTLALAGTPGISEFKLVRSSETQLGAELDPVPVAAGKATLMLPAWSVTTLLAQTH